MQPSALRVEVDAMRASVAKRRDSLPALRAELGELVDAQRTLGDARHVHRRRFHLQERERDVREEIERVETGHYEAEFEAKVAPFLKAEDSLQKVQRQEASRLGIVEVESGQHGALLAECRTEFGLDTPAIQVRDKDVCPMCTHSLVLVQLKALLTCSVCGYSTPHVDSTSGSLSYDNDMTYAAFHYKRQTHFEDWLKQLQAKENTVVGDDILRDVMGVLHARGVTIEQVTHKLVREALKELKLRWCYDYTTQITSKITGKPPPRLTSDIEEKCRVMFVAMQPHFEKHAAGRTNFLSYPYCLYKFFQLLGLDEHLHCFNLLKGKDKMEKMDDIFKKIAGELGWEWVPS